jgi:hypothetical protein
MRSLELSLRVAIGESVVDAKLDEPSGAGRYVQDRITGGELREIVLDR